MIEERMEKITDFTNSSEKRRVSTVDNLDMQNDIIYYKLIHFPIL